MTEHQDEQDVEEGRAPSWERGRRRKAVGGGSGSRRGWFGWPILGTAAGAIVASAVTWASQEISLPTAKAAAAADYAESLKSSYEVFGERADQFDTAAMSASDAMLLGSQPRDVRVQFRALDQAWGRYQRIYKDAWLAADAAGKGGAISLAEASFLKTRLRRATSASLRVYRCVRDAVDSYGPGAPGMVTARNEPSLRLRCADGESWYEMDAELDRVASCNAALRTSMIDLLAVMNVERHDSPLEVAKRRLFNQTGTGAQGLNARWPEISRSLDRDCGEDMTAPRTRLVGALHPWQVDARFRPETGTAAQDGLIPDLAQPGAARSGAAPAPIPLSASPDR